MIKLNGLNDDLNILYINIDNVDYGIDLLNNELLDCDNLPYSTNLPFYFNVNQNWDSETTLYSIDCYLIESCNGIFKLLN